MSFDFESVFRIYMYHTSEIIEIYTKGDKKVELVIGFEITKVCHTLMDGLRGVIKRVQLHWAR